MMAAAMRRHYWNLERFGFTAPKLLRRLWREKGPRVLCVCVPKSGTHLLERGLCVDPQLRRKLLPTVNEVNLTALGGLDALLSRVRPGEVVISHLYHSAGRERLLRARGVRTLFMIRDPRDLVVSQAHYIARNPQHPLHLRFRELPELGARLSICIRGDEQAGFPGLAERLERFGGWLDGDALAVRFESLVGSAGGGSEREQGETLAGVYRHLGLPADPQRIAERSRRTFSAASPTFRRGTTGQWREVFDAGLAQAFKQEAGEQLVRYGYEQDSSW